MKRHLPLLFAALALMASCSKEPIFEMADELGMIPLNIDGSIKQVTTKATAQGFVDKDAVGLYAVNYTDNNSVAGTLAATGNQADNVKYVFDESAQKWTPVRAVYYKNVNTNVDLYVYYPYQSSISNPSEAGFEVQKDQSAAASVTALSGYEASDWLWGKASNITPSESKVSIPLSHRLSAVQVTLVKGSGFEEGEFEAIGKSVILTNTTRKAMLDYSSGVATPLGSPQLDGIVMCPQASGGFRAIVIPQSVAAGTQLFAITLDGISYSFKQEAVVDYQVGKQMNVNITLSKKGHAGEYELTLASTQITDWTEDQNTHGGEARQYYVLNVETPGTLGRTLKQAGKHPDRIRNLKITGTLTNEDFFFMRDSMAILSALNLYECKTVAIGTKWTDDNHLKITGEYIDDAIPLCAFKGKRTLSYIVFPRITTVICDEAFRGSNLSSALYLPEGLKEIRDYAFMESSVTTISFPSTLEKIGYAAFSSCTSAYGDLILPEGLKSIGGYAFGGCKGFGGRLSLPTELEYLGDSAFRETGIFKCDLIIPDKVKEIPESCFWGTKFDGFLDLGNVEKLGERSFGDFTINGYSGELVIPEGVVEIPAYCFYGGRFTSVCFPESLKIVGERAFFYAEALCEAVVFPEGTVTIASQAFCYCRQIPALVLPQSLMYIGQNAFFGCYGVSSIRCAAVEPPSAYPNSFDGVAKDNFNVSVPGPSVMRYRTDSGWSDFKRITPYCDFSISRERMRAVNGAQSRKYVLRAPSGYSWSVDERSLPEWITVSPMSGEGKTDVMIGVTDMPRTSDTFEINEGTYNEPQYQSYKGRKGTVTFKLDDKDYSIGFTVEQYDSDNEDGAVLTLHTATRGSGIDIVFTGDGYDAKDIAAGKFNEDAAAGYGHFFDIEPYKTYKDYFNVYAVTAQSDDSGIGTLNTIKDCRFNSTYTQCCLTCPDPNVVMLYARNAVPSIDSEKSLVILLTNMSGFEGKTYLYPDGSALSCCPVSKEQYPYDFRGIIQHEAGGHGFGKLGDENIYHNAYIQNCNCKCCEHPKSDNDIKSSFGYYKSLGWYKNLSMNGDMKQVPWSHLIYHPQYSDYVDIFEGGYMHSRGVFRSEATSCMNNNIPYYSAISRQAIVERIKACVGEEFNLEDFYSKDVDINRPITKGGAESHDRTFGVDPLFHRGSGLGPVYMGEHPNVK